MPKKDFKDVLLQLSVTLINQAFSCSKDSKTGFFLYNDTSHFGRYHLLDLLMTLTKKLNDKPVLFLVESLLPYKNPPFISNTF